MPRPVGCDIQESSLGLTALLRVTWTSCLISNVFQVQALKPDNIGFFNND